MKKIRKEEKMKRKEEKMKIRDEMKEIKASFRFNKGEEDREIANK
jgi:hypothetical protein